MAESNKYSLDVLPDEVILKIIGNLETLTDKSNVAQVSQRFNSLANDKCWRKSIYISFQEFDCYFGEESKKLWFLEALEKEVSESYRLESLTLPLDGPLHQPSRSEIVEKFRNTDTIVAKLINTKNCNSVCTIFNGNSLKYIIVSFSPKYVDVDSGRFFRFHPTNTIGLEFKGNDSSILEKILAITADTIRDVTYEGPIIRTLLVSLSNCKDLKHISLRGTIDPHVIRRSTIPKIRCEKIDLIDLLCISKEEKHQVLADLFYSDKLIEFHTYLPNMVGIENIWSITPNLCTVSMQVCPDNEFQISFFENFCDKLFHELNKDCNSNCCLIEIFHLRDGFIEALDNSLERNLTVKNYGIKCNGHSAMVTIKNKQNGDRTRGTRMGKRWKRVLPSPREELFTMMPHVQKIAEQKFRIGKRRES